MENVPIHSQDDFVMVGNIRVKTSADIISDGEGIAIKQTTISKNEDKELTTHQTVYIDVEMLEGIVRGIMGKLVGQASKTRIKFSSHLERLYLTVNEHKELISKLAGMDEEELDVYLADIPDEEVKVILMALVLTDALLLERFGEEDGS